MKLVTKAIVSRLRDNISDFNREVHGSLLPQSASYPAALVRVAGIDPVHSKDGRTASEVYFIEISVYSSDAETTADLAAQVRDALDYKPPYNVKDVKVMHSRFLTGEESGFISDDVEMFTWTLQFQMRVHDVC